MSNRARQNINEEHNRLRSLVDGGQMRPAHEYKPPPNWVPPQQRQQQQHHNDPWGGPNQNQGGQSHLDVDRRRPGGYNGPADNGGYNRGPAGDFHNGSQDYNNGNHFDNHYNNVNYITQ